MAGTHPRTQLRSSAPHHLRTQIWLICARKPFAGLIYAHRRFCGPFKLPEKHTYCLAMAPSYSKFNPRVAHKRDAASDWHLPTLNSTLEGLPRCNQWFLSTLNFTFGWSTKGTLRCNGFFLLKISPLGCPQKGCYVVMASFYSKCYPRVAHKRDAALQWLLPTLNFTFGWPTKGMLRWNGSFPL